MTGCQYDSIEQMISDVLSSGSVVLPNGECRKIKSNVSLSEALQIARTIRLLGCRHTAETGMAYGISSLAICAALRESGIEGAIHVAIDPNQSSEYGGAALSLLRQYGLDKFCRPMEGATHTEAPKLIAEGVTLDFAFIDGWHTFDYTFIDFFMLDKMLRPGGILAFHDAYGPAKRRVVNFMLSHRKYKLLPYRKVPRLRTIREIAAKLLRGKTLRGKANCLCYVDRRPSLIFLEKVEAWEPNYDFYRKF